MNTMNMPGMNPAAGGPVGGGVAMMNNAATPNEIDSNEQMRISLNTHIYDYMIKNGYHDCARALYRDDKFQIMVNPNTKQSPGRQVNGMDDMDTDSKDDTRIPDDLPRPKMGDTPNGSSFLFDWWCLFSDMFRASRTKGKPGQMSATKQYLAQTEQLQRIRENQNGQMLRNPQMMAQQMGQFNGMRGQLRNGAMPNEMQKTMMRNNMASQQMQQQMANKQQMMQNMQREQPEMDMNGHRPQSPASGDNTGSPNKRPRLDQGAQFNGQQMGPNGRGQGMPANMGNQAMTNMLVKNGINPQGLTPAQFASFQQQSNAVQQKSIQVYAQTLAQHHNRSAMNQGAMPNGMMNPGVMPNQGSPMMQNMNENFMLDPNYSAAVNAQMRANMQQGGAGGQGGNHALQDYQMQLMLLEQQNKKRLMMARQEQDSMTRPDGQPGIPAQQGMQPPGMSPSGSRNGPSPNPSDQMKRTPQLGQAGIPGSPTPGGPGGSPAGMNFNNGMGQDFNNQIFAMSKMGEGMMPGQGIRPPNGMNPNMPAGRMPGGNWQGGPGGQPMIQQPSQQGQNQPMGTPQQRNEMPPPQAPAAAGANAGRGTQPSSPSTSTAAPPTPQQGNKANPAAKKKAKDSTAKRPQKKGSTAPGPGANASESTEPPATPTPSTPITPVHANSFNKNAPSSGNAAAANASAPTSAPQPANANAGQPQQNAVAQPQANLQNNADQTLGMSNGPFGEFNGVDQTFNLEFGPLDAPDVLENFDFDSFLNNPDDNPGGMGNFNFDTAGLGLDGGYGVEGGAEV